MNGGSGSATHRQVNKKRPGQVLTSAIKTRYTLLLERLEQCIKHHAHSTERVLQVLTAMHRFTPELERIYKLITEGWLS